MLCQLNFSILPDVHHDWNIKFSAHHQTCPYLQQRTCQGGARVTQMGPISNQCLLLLSVHIRTDRHTNILRYDGLALVDGPLGWSEKASNLRSMSFQPDEQSASSKDLYPNQ
ncbi:hypothetical protein GOODEAATRI_017655 [Goodea atripinnis]|uniref:Uncharacterized protein n=1 Tax=Goodea atripinnis TaxID=208336 RepID=A0ABV0N2B6_9TELE